MYRMSIDNNKIRLAIASLISYIAFVMSLLFIGSYLSNREITPYMLKYTFGVTSPCLAAIFFYSILYIRKIRTGKFFVDFPATGFYFILIPLIYNISLLIRGLRLELSKTVTLKDFAWIVSSLFAAVVIYISIELITKKNLKK